MGDMKIPWYSINRDLAVEHHGAVGLDEALEIVDRYLARGGEVFEYGEDALAATMFGFCRSEFEFIEICIHGPNQIAYLYELSEPETSWFRRLLGRRVYNHEDELHSLEELTGRVQEFFSLPTPDLQCRLENRP